MNTFRFSQQLLRAMVVLISAVWIAGFSAQAQADGFHHHGYGHGHGGVRLGVYLGGPGYYGYYGSSYYPPYYYPRPYPVVVVPAAPPVYIQQPAQVVQAPAATADTDWFYCADTRAYYPYVRECAVAWQRVPSQPITR